MYNLKKKTSFSQYVTSDSPGRHSSAPVVINIHDIDDNDPVFDNPQYTVHVREEASKQKHNVAIIIFTLYVINLVMKQGGHIQ